MSLHQLLKIIIIIKKITQKIIDITQLSPFTTTVTTEREINEH